MVEVEVKPVRPRLSVSPHTVRIKVLPGTPEEGIARLVRIAEQVAELLRPRIQITARGRFNFHAGRILMHVGEKQKQIGDFRFDLAGNVWEEPS